MSASQKHQLHVSERNVRDQKASKLRRDGKTIANIYGEEKDSQAITIDRGEALRYLKSEGDSALVYLVAEDKKETPVLIEEIQYDPVTEEPIHIAFKRVNLKEKVTAEVPVEMTGEADIPSATVFLVKDMLEVEALPTDLPEAIVLDISGLEEIDQTLTLSDAQYDREKVTVLLSEEEQSEPLVIVQEIKEEVEEAPEEAAEGEDGEQPEESSDADQEEKSPEEVE